MVEMTCEEHDRQAASTQFITHTVGRILGTMDLQVRPCSLGDSQSAELPTCVQRNTRRWPLGWQLQPANSTAYACVSLHAHAAAASGSGNVLS